MKREPASREIRRSENRKDVKGLDEVCMQNEKSGDGGCVEFFYQFDAPDDMACISENFPTSMVNVLTLSQHSAS